MAQSTRVGFVGFGEVGSVWSKQLSQNGVTQMPVFASGKRNGPPYSAEFRQKVESRGGQLVNSVDEVVANSDVIISAVVVAAAEQVGTQIARAMKPGQVLVDINSCGPKTKVAVSEAAALSGGLYADAAVLGNVTLYGLDVPIKTSGTGAQEFERRMTPLGMKIQVLGDRAGDAATIKMIRSQVMKGCGMIILEALLTGAQMGLAAETFQAITEPMDAVRFSDWAKMGVRTNGLAAQRRADETREAISLMEEAGIDPVMARGTLERLERLISLNFREIFPGEPPADYREYLPHYREVRPAGAAR